MAPKTNLLSHRTKPETPGLMKLEVLRSTHVTPNMMRVTLGGRDITQFVPLGFDQWFRLIIPKTPAGIDKLPAKLTMRTYFQMQVRSEAERPVVRNYTVREYRAEGEHGPEIDVDFVLHGTDAEHSGPAALWAKTCEPGAVVGVIDEGCTYAAPTDTDVVVVIVDESGLPAAAGILASMPRTERGIALIEVATVADQQELDAPSGVEVRYMIRDDAHALPGRAAYAAAQAIEIDGTTPYIFVAGEQSLATDTRRHFVKAGVDRRRIGFIGYWRIGKSY